MKTFSRIILSLVFCMFFSANAQQIDWNKIDSNTVLGMNIQQNITESLSSVVIQAGDGNNANLSLNSKSEILVRQLGNQNSIYFDNSFSQKEAKTVVNTEGNNNIIDITGTNSISESLHLNIKADNKTVFMRNY